MSNHPETLESLWRFCQENGRVVPTPTRWNELFEMLPNKERTSSGGWSPSLPLILAAWHHTNALEKMLRLKEHLEYADKNGVLSAVSDFLRSLPETDWVHLGEV
jgi:hypothetical protein